MLHCISLTAGCQQSSVMQHVAEQLTLQLKQAVSTQGGGAVGSFNSVLTCPD